MFDERAFIARVELADTEELIGILERPNVEEERALRAHLGDERFRRMHGMALKRNVTRSVRRASRGNVVVIHGIMGAELNVSSGGEGDLTWVNAFRIMRGWLDRLRLADDGRSEYSPKFKVRASGIMKRYYGELLLSLSQNWDVRAFWFDWRKDLQLAADELNTQIGGWFGSDRPVHIVAHSMGGLVARTFVKKYDERWGKMWDTGRDKPGGPLVRPPGTAGGRLVMLGTPNHGSFAIPQVITGIEGLVKKLALIDVRHTRRGLLDTFNSFVGSYQMLPSPLVMRTMERLYQSGTYGGYNVPQRHLDNARAHHDFLSDAVDPERMIYVAGFDQPTFDDIKLDGGGAFLPLDDEKSYGLTLDGDGRVPHALGRLRRDGREVPTYFARVDHGNLSSDAKILAALDELLETGATDDLSKTLDEARAVTRRAVAATGAAADAAAGAKGEEQAIGRWRRESAEDERRMRISLRRMGARSVEPDAVAYARAAGDEEAAVEDEAERERAARFSPEQRKLEETITRGFLAFRGDDETEGEEEREDEREEIERGEIEIALVHGKIEEVHRERPRGARTPPVDAVAVGHYIGVNPQGGERKLDEAVSRALLGRPEDDRSDIGLADLVLTQYTERGIIHGKLGEPFFLPDPRAAAAAGGARSRLVVLAGMGEAGRFGMPELTVLARELCWALGRIDRTHLATILIGTGNGNLSMQEAITGWLNGIRRAVTGSRFDAGRRLRRVTFVEYDPRKVGRLKRLIEEEARRQEKLGLAVRFLGPGEDELAALEEDAARWDRADWKRKQEEGDAWDASGRAPTRVTLGLDAEQKTYRFGAITADASVPEREIVIDPAVVMQANDELAAERKARMQLERGRFLEELLMPDELRRALYNPAPLVMMLDATTARIHWEMVAQPAAAGAGSAAGDRVAGRRGGGSGGDRFEYRDDFLGTCRGFTRQLRTTFAPPPEPPPPPRRVLRVLVVADPAEDAHLPGAQEEGVAVADLFESYNTIFRDRPPRRGREDGLGQSRVEVTRLFGPVEATRTNVLRELMIRQYDVLHFAGHCVYQWDGDPALSGWIFNAGRREVLSATELNRIDRVPKFVFSNACESGITPDRSGDRSVHLAPSFAEAFFARGVANFVCTAWPVDDIAARVFALTLYAGLLGYDDGAAAEPNRRPEPREGGAKHMHAAMRDARIAVAETPDGRTTWGAYQHYGNPYFQFFYAKGEGSEQPEVLAETKRARATKKAATAKKTATKKRAPAKGARKR